MTNELAIASPITALAPRPCGLELRTLDDMWQFSQIIAETGLAPRGMESIGKIFVAVQMGAELGLSPMMALQNIGVINGKPGVYGDAALALVRQSGLLEVFRETMEGAEDAPDYCAVCIVKRKGFEATETRFSVKDAKKAALWGKSGPWSQYPARMLKFRARGFALRDEFADILKGFKTTEELQDFPEETRRVEAVAIPSASANNFQKADTSAPVEQPIVFKGGKYDGVAPEDLPWGVLSKFLAHWDAGNKVRPELRAEVERVQSERAKDMRATVEIPTPAPSAFAQKIEAAKIGNPEEEELFEQDASEPSSAFQEQGATDSQRGAVAAIASRVFGRETRDEQVLALIQDKFGAQSTLGALTASQASQLIGDLKERLNAVAPDTAPAPVADKPKGSPLKRLMAIINKAGLSMEAAHKALRLEAVNTFLSSTNHEAVSSFKEIAPGTMYSLGVEIEAGNVKWDAPTEDELGDLVVEGEVSE